MQEHYNISVPRIWLCNMPGIQHELEEMFIFIHKTCIETKLETVL